MWDKHRKINLPPQCALSFSRQTAVIIHTLTEVNFYCSDPQTWTKGQVAKWITEVCDLFGINEAEVSMLKTLSGAELNNLRPKDWKERSPKRGDMLLNLWNTRMETSQPRQRVADDTSKTPPASTMKGLFFKNR